MLNTISKEFNALLKFLPGHVYLYDVDGVIVACNLKQANELGFSTIDEAVGVSIYDVRKPDEIEHLKKYNQKVIDSKEPHIFDEFVFDKDGKKIFLTSNKVPIIDEAQKVVGILGISIEVDQEIAHVKSLSKMFSELIDFLPAHIYWKDKEGAYLGCNLAQAKSAGVQSQSQLLGKTDAEMPWSEQAKALRARDLDVMQSKQMKTFEEDTTTVDGVKRVFLSKKMPWIDPQKNVQGIVGISFDVTAQKELEQAHNELIAKELKSAILVSASIAHEVRTPMATIQNLVEIIRELQPDLKPETEDYLESITKETNRTNEFINILLANIKKIDTSRFTQVKIRKCIFDAVDRFPYSNEKDRALITIEEPIEDFEFYGDDNLMVHVFFNLIKNAIFFIKASKKGEITIHYEATDDKHLLYFTDTACGIPEDILVNIFDSFYTTSKVGSGIGLSFCKMAFEAFGGKIRCVSEVDKYTKFIMEFPKRG